LAELYFESLEGIGNASRFTPLNGDVREEFRCLRGFDPMELFRKRTDPESRRAFLDFRAELAARIEREWLLQVERPGLDVVLTHVDDRLDTGMRDAIGADAARLLPLLERHPFTFLVEDPATVWHLGPQRYAEIARRYNGLTARRERLAIDINIAERYQDVYPTKQQTGVELFQLVHVASDAFPRVALYSEYSVLQPDIDLLPSAAAVVTRFERVGPRFGVESKYGVGIRWQGPALVDGRPWPLRSRDNVWVPAGAHTVEAAPEDHRAVIEDFNGEVDVARYGDRGQIEISYRGAAAAFALVSRKVVAVEVDGGPAAVESAGDRMLRLPRGQHVVTIRTE
ncbi:MAG: hypothetical protein M1436_02420, partial [Acidobacteria bacterium]|nr:hypothetical protein [Acidobacteriota bacterium]